MSWGKARGTIIERIEYGTHLDDADSRRLIVSGFNHDGFEVQVRSNHKINLKWFVLEHSWRALNEKHVFNREVFAEIFGYDCLGNQLYVEIVGQIFIRAGLAKFHENTYHNYKDKLYSQLMLELDARFLKYA